MKEAIEDYLSREEWEESFVADAMASLADYEETGLHITHEEFSAWVDALDKDPNTPMPECHT